MCKVLLVTAGELERGRCESAIERFAFHEMFNSTDGFYNKICTF